MNSPESTKIQIWENYNLEQCETVIHKGLKTFVEVGSALRTIREKQLYKEHFSTFEEYCKEKWKFTAGYARNLIGAATVVNNLESGSFAVGLEEKLKFLPETEFQARPLAKLGPDQQLKAWQKAVEDAKDGKPTGKQVEEAVKEMFPELSKKNKKEVIPDEPETEEPEESTEVILDDFEVNVFRTMLRVFGSNKSVLAKLVLALGKYGVKFLNKGEELNDNDMSYQILSLIDSILSGAEKENDEHPYMTPNVYEVIEKEIINQDKEKNLPF